MSDDREPLQTDEVVQALNLAGECALVHAETETELYIFTDRHNPREPWLIKYFAYQLPEPDFLKQALAVGFLLQSHEDRTGSRYELFRNCMGIRAAAIKALTLMRLLPGVPPTAWLWITCYEYDQRDETPEKPEPWPPAGT